MEGSIPVGSELIKSTSAALKIQKAYKGFIVRKKIKTISGIKKQVEDIEKYVLSQKMVDSMKKNNCEQLKVMKNMLFDLFVELEYVDVVVDSRVRDFQTAVKMKIVRLIDRYSEDEEVGLWEVVDDDDSLSGSFDNAFDQHDETSKKASAETEMYHVEDQDSEDEVQVEDRSEDKIVQLMEKNEVLTGMVSELYENNKKQAKSIDLLIKKMEDFEESIKREQVERMDNLEKSFKLELPKRMNELERSLRSELRKKRNMIQSECTCNMSFLSLNITEETPVFRSRKHVRQIPIFYI